MQKNEIRKIVNTIRVLENLLDLKDDYLFRYIVETIEKQNEKRDENRRAALQKTASEPRARGERLAK